MRGLEKNQTLEEILTINHNEHQYDDTLGHIFPDSISICKYYNITKDQFHKRLKSNKSMIETIGVIPFINSSTKETTIYPNYIVQEHLSENYFLCTICEHDIIRSYDEIIMDAQKYYKQNT